MKPLILAALLLVRPCIRGEEVTTTRLVLLSYCISDGVYGFALLSRADYEAIVSGRSGHKREFTDAGYLRSVRALEWVLENRVPARTVIEWRQWSPADTCYPPQPVIDKVRMFAAACDIAIRFAPFNGND